VEVSVTFGKSIERHPELIREIKNGLDKSNVQYSWIGAYRGIFAGNMSWIDAFTFACRITYVLRSEAVIAIDGIRLVVQDDVEVSGPEKLQRIIDKKKLSS
jgi:hypothetical protein